MTEKNVLMSNKNESIILNDRTFAPKKYFKDEINCKNIFVYFFFDLFAVI